MEQEFWRVTTDEPLAIAVGFQPDMRGIGEVDPLTEQEFLAMAEEGECENLMQWEEQADADLWIDEWEGAEQ
ncbi:MAG: hypothetical protein JRJ69_15715 [Deltaproteobacteria bacterium]|nr:hypothetical protein [Deltaproteobacteria bacterium]